jgi:hypothetical protein
VRLKRLRHKRRHGGALPVADSSLLLLIGMCPLLEELHLVDKAEFDGSGDVTDIGLLALADRALTLRTLKLKLALSSSAERCSEVAVMELASVCKLLTHVELSNFKRLSDPPVYELIQVRVCATNCFLRALYPCHCLKHFSCCFCCFGSVLNG